MPASAHARHEVAIRLKLVLIDRSPRLVLRGPVAGNEDLGHLVSTTEAVKETRVRVGVRARSDPTDTG